MVMGNLFGDSDTAKTVHNKDINCLATETLGAQRRIIKFKVKLHPEVDEEEIRWTPILGVASTYSDDGVGL